MSTFGVGEPCSKVRPSKDAVIVTVMVVSNHGAQIEIGISSRYILLWYMKSFLQVAC